MEQATVKKRPRVVLEFEAVLADTRLSARERVSAALRYDPFGKAGAVEVRARQERMRAHAARLKANLDPRPKPRYWDWLSVTDSADLGRALGAKKAYNHEKGAHEDFSVLSLVKDPRSYRRAIAETLDGRHRREWGSGDRDLITKFTNWYSKHRRPLYSADNTFYEPHPKMRGRGSTVLRAGQRVFEALLDLQALRQSGWTPETSPGFNCSAFLNYDPVDTPHGRRMTMLALQGKSVEGRMPGGELYYHEIQRDLHWCLETGSPNALPLIPAGGRVFSFTCDQNFEQLKARERVTLVAAAAGLPKSRVEEIRVFVVTPNPEATAAIASAVESAPVATAWTKEHYTVHLIDDEKLNGVSFYPTPTGTFGALLDQPQPFATVEEARATVSTAQFPRLHFGPAPRFEILRHTSTPVEVVTPAGKGGGKQDGNRFRISVAIVAGLSRSKKKS